MKRKKVNSMDKAGYICQGTCQAFITQEQYDGGLTACGTQGCTCKDKPFVKGFQCQVCGAVYAEGTQHTHTK